MSVVSKPAHIGVRDHLIGAGLALAYVIVLHGGLDYHDERDENKGPITLRVLVDGREVGKFVHRDGDGMARYEVDLRSAFGAQVPARGELRLEISAIDTYRRSFCWTGTVQNGRRKEAP